MGATASQASLVILQSLVRGLSEAIIRRAPSSSVVDLEDIQKVGGANASKVLKLAAAMKAKGALICIFFPSVEVLFKVLNPSR
jgi:hypothetical protein